MSAGRGVSACFRHVRRASGQRLGELLQALIDLLEGLRAGGKQPLECNAEVGFQDVAFPLLGFIGVEVLGGGNGVASLMLGKIHRGVSHLDQLLGRGAVHRKAGDAEAAGNIFLAQQRVRTDPGAQLGGELLGLLDRGLRHQDDELIAAVA